MLETLVQGTKVSLLELQLKVVHTLINHQNVDHAQQKEMGRIAFSAGTDVQSRHRLTLESTIGFDFSLSLTFELWKLFSNAIDTPGFQESVFTVSFFFKS